MRKSLRFQSVAGLFALGVVAACAHAPASEIADAAAQTWTAAGLVTSAADVVFEPVAGLEGVETATVFGNADEAGPYAVRIRVAAGVLTPPHFHDHDRHITVIEGEWAFGVGTTQSCDDTVTVQAGGVALHPAGVVHYDGSCGGPVVVQINGMGPVKTVLVSGDQ
jgi:quercetin dioxygenase-like cupin family protein